MSAGKNHQSCQTYRYRTYQYRTYRYQTYRLPLNAAVISAVARADARGAPHRSLGLHPLLGAAPGCPATPGSGGGAEAPGGWTR